MIISRKLNSSILSVFIALSLLLKLYPYFYVDPPDQNYNSYILSGICTCNLPVQPYLNRLLIPEQEHEFHWNTIRRIRQFNSLLFYAGLSLHSIPFTYLLCVFIWLLCNNLSYTRKYIIRYIHDQDGHKRSSFVLLEILQFNGGYCNEQYRSLYNVRHYFRRYGIC